MHPRTKRQKEVLDYISRYIENHGYEPSYQQIARDLGVASKAGIAKHIEALERQGFLQRNRENGKFNLVLRSNESVADLVTEIRWLDLPQDPSPPISATVFVPNLILDENRPGRIYAFRVTDNSMIGENICEGDIALVEKRSFARDGDCVVAIVERKKTTLKTFFRDGAHIRLCAANDEFDDVRVSAEKVEIKGVLRGLLRPLQ